MLHNIDARPNKQMIRIPENDLRLELAQFPRSDRLHGALRPNRHKRRRVNHAMRGRQSSVPRFRMPILYDKLKHRGSSARRIHSRKETNEHELITSLPH